MTQILLNDMKFKLKRDYHKYNSFKFTAKTLPSFMSSDLRGSQQFMNRCYYWFIHNNIELKNCETNISGQIFSIFRSLIQKWKFRIEHNERSAKACNLETVSVRNYFTIGHYWLIIKILIKFNRQARLILYHKTSFRANSGD